MKCDLCGGTVIDEKYPILLNLRNGCTSLNMCQPKSVCNAAKGFTHPKQLKRFKKLFGRTKNQIGILKHRLLILFLLDSISNFIQRQSVSYTTRIFHLVQAFCMAFGRFGHLCRLRQTSQQSYKETSIDGKTKRVNSGVG